MSELDDFLGPRTYEIDPDALNNITPAQWDGEWGPPPTAYSMARGGQLIGELWGVPYLSSGARTKADMRTAAKSVLEDCGGEWEPFEAAVNAMKDDPDALLWAKRCKTPHGVARQVRGWIAKANAQAAEENDPHRYLRDTTPEREAQR